jgi:hypothetical protein
MNLAHESRFPKMASALPMSLACSLAMWAAVAQAAPPFVWLESGPGETALVHVGPLLPAAAAAPGVREEPVALSEAKAIQASRTLSFSSSEKGYVIAVPPGSAGDLRFTARLLDSDGSLVIYNARAGRSEVLPSSDLELVPTEPNGTKFRLYYKGKPVPATQVNVETSSGWRRTLVPAADGSVSLTSPEFPKLFPSRYVLDAGARVGGRFSFGNKFMDSATFNTTLSFEVKE